MSKEWNRGWHTLGCKLRDVDYERALAAAKAAGKTVSAWASKIILGELNGENHDFLGDLVRNLPIMPQEPTKLRLCHQCHNTYEVRANPVFVPDGMDRPAPVFEDPGCPYCDRSIR